MTKPTNNPFKDIKWLITNLSIIGMGITILWSGMKYMAESDTRMFESPEQRQKTKSHINSDYNEVKNYQLQQELKKMKVELDTSYAWVNATYKEDRAQRKLDSIDKAKAIKSRAKRDSLMAAQEKVIEELSREQKLLTNTNQVILDELRNIKKTLDTLNQ